MTKAENIKVYKSACRSCHGGCGVLVYVEDGRIIRIEGDPDSPLNRGQLCRKGPTSIEHVYSPDRLLYPMKRAGARGEGKWDRITWDDAYEIITTKLQQIIDEDGVHCIALGAGTGRHHCNFVPRFANVLGTPNWCEPGTAQCFFPRVNVTTLTYGGHLVCDYYSDVKPECILVWGHNPLNSGPDGELQFHAKKLLRTDTRFIVVDPRRTKLAENAAVWLQLRPGTDDALALSLINVIITEDLYDKPFVEQWTYGFEKLAEHVREFTPEWAEPITWVPAAKIREAARLFATVKPGTVEWGCAVEHSPNSIQSCRAIAILPALTGNIEKKGTWVAGSNLFGEFPFLRDNLTDEARAKRLGGAEFRVLGEANVVPSAHIPAVFKAMRTGKPYPIRAFLIFGNNPLASYANSKLIHESLQKVEFLSVMDLYMTPSAELSDLVLPAASWLELDCVTGFPYFAESTVLAQQKLAQVGESKQDEIVFMELARRMNLRVGQEDIEEVFNSQLVEHFQVTFEDLKKTGFAYKPFTYNKHESGGFNTESGRIELYSLALEKLGYDPLPCYVEPPESPLSTPEVADEYPYVLISGARTPNFFISEHRQNRKLRAGHPDPLVEIHPDTAAGLEIVDGEWVWIETRRGKITQKAKLTDGIDPRVIHVEMGWWFPERKSEDLECGIWESNANVLTSMDPPYDPAIGTYQLRALLCKVYKQ